MGKHWLLILDEPLRRLLRLQATGRIRRTIKKLSSPRRAIPTALVFVLMALYMVKVYIAVAHYQGSSNMPIGDVAPVGMLYILLLKLLGICVDRRKAGSGFRREETHNLVGGPFQLQQVRLFRVAGHAANIFVTSLFAAVFFAFHVESFAAAVVGSYAAMLFTYLAYTNIAVMAAAMSEKTYRRCRTLGCSLAVGMIVWLLFRASQQQVSNFAFIQAFGYEAIRFSKLPGVSLFMSPFFVFTNMIMANSVGGWLTWLVPSIALNYLGLQLLLFLEIALERKKERRERADYLANRDSLVAPNQITTKDLSPYFGNVAWLWGTGPIMWRQAKGILRLQRGLCWLLIPMALALAGGAYLAYDAEDGPFQTIAVVVVLTSVFLPGLLPFDFRGDLKGLPALKSMPIPPFAVVVGQLSVPVVLLTAFQALALSTLLLHDVTQWSSVLWTVLFLIPLNVAIVALENLVFLLYPYRIAEFDMQATVRRVVMLMAKFFVVFFVALVGILASLGIVGLKFAVDQTVFSSVVEGAWVPMLVVSELLAFCCVSLSVVWVTCRVYRRFDLTEDLPL